MNEYSFKPNMSQIIEATIFARIKKIIIPATVGILRMTKRKNLGCIIIKVDRKSVRGAIMMVEIVKKLNHVLSIFI